MPGTAVKLLMVKDLPLGMIGAHVVGGWRGPGQCTTKLTASLLLNTTRWLWSLSIVAVCVSDTRSTGRSSSLQQFQGNWETGSSDLALLVLCAAGHAPGVLRTLRLCG